MTLIVVPTLNGRDLIDELNRCMPAAKHLGLGTLLQALIDNVNALDPSRTTDSTAITAEATRATAAELVLHNKINAIIAAVNGISAALDAVPVAGNYVANFHLTALA